MPQIHFVVDASGVDQASARLAALMGQSDWITAQSLTAAARSARKAIQREIFPKIEGGPNRWTQRGLISSKATPRELRVQVGFTLGRGRFTDQLGSRGSSGVPAGEYMTTGARGMTRRPAKSTEKTLIQKGLIDRKQRLIPNEKQLRTTNGNVSGATLKAIVNRIQTVEDLRIAKDTLSQKKKGKRKSRKKPFSDYFVMHMKGNRIVNRYGIGEPAFIAKRTGKNKRGFAPVLYLTNNASYERRFPIETVAMEEFKKQFNISFVQGVERELKRRTSGKYK
jgi:hypothetical protein